MEVENAVAGNAQNAVAENAQNAVSENAVSENAVAEWERRAVPKHTAPIALSAP